MKRYLGFIILGIAFSCNSPKPPSMDSAAPENVPENLKGSFSISGAYALYPLVNHLAEQFMAVHPDVKIEVTRVSSGEGLADLLSGNCHLAMISRALTDEETTAGIWVIPLAKDGVAPVVNQRNPNIQKILDQGISPDEFMQVFTSGKQMTWGEILASDSKDKISVLTREEGAGASDVWASFLYKKASDLKGRIVEGDEEMIRRIQEDPLALGFCNFSYAFDVASGERKEDIQIVPCDLDFDDKIDRVEVPFRTLEEGHRSLWLGFYPDLLCRELTIGSMGKPSDPVIVEFLRYALGDGQAEVKKSGYCPLNNVYLQYARNSLK